MVTVLNLLSGHLITGVQSNQDLKFEFKIISDFILLLLTPKNQQRTLSALHILSHQINFCSKKNGLQGVEFILNQVNDHKNHIFALISLKFK